MNIKAQNKNLKIVKENKNLITFIIFIYLYNNKNFLIENHLIPH